MAVSETKLLRQKDPKIKNSDDWPSYTLTKAKVLSKATGELVSLLAAHSSHAVKVLGSLEAVDVEYAANVKDDKYRSRTVELDDIITYAFAEYHDGTYGFWAAGKAGWFELKDPAPAYKDTFAGMNEAASMFYMLADKLRRAYKANARLSTKALDRYANAIFRDYLLHSNHARRVDADDVRDGFHDHREFIITCMLEAQEGLDWQKAPIFNYFKLKFPDTVAEVESRMARNRGQLDPEADYEEGAKPVTSQGASSNGKPKKRSNRRSQPRTPIKGTAEAVEISDTSDEEAIDFANPQGTSRKRKSILQPKGSKYSKKATGRRQSLRPTSVNATDDYDETQDMEKASPLATVAPRNTTTNKAPPKKHSSALDDYASHHEYLPRKYTEVRVVEYKIPSAEPQGPGDLWTCSFESCRHRVHAASTIDGKAKVNEHLTEHVDSVQAKIDLALQESRPYLPVDNLVRRLQQFTPKSDNLINSARLVATDGHNDAPVKKFPPRIKRSGY